MTDLTDRVLPALRDHRLAGLDFGPGVVHPDYGGRSILNLPATLCRWLGAPGLGAGPLDPAVLGPLSDVGDDEIQRVVLVLMDALSHQRLRRWMADGSAPVWEALAQQGSLAPITSIVPSTTSAALTSLWSGRSAAEHGTAGYELWLKEYGVVTNMITHTPFSFHGDPGGLGRAGFDPETFLAVPTLGPHLTGHGVGVYVFQHHSIIRSGLSKMNLKGAEMHGFATPADLWVSVRRLLESKIGERMFAWVYWDAVDTLSHLYGPDSETVVAEFSHFSAAFERYALSRLSAAARTGTLLILVADHGQVATRKDPHYDLRHHPGLVRRLHMRPTGENRLAYLYVRPGQVEAVREYLERTWPNQFAVVDSAYAVGSGLFGPGQPHPRLQERLGDLLVVALGDAYLWWGFNENPILGRHGGLSPDEMFVPLLAARL